MNEQAIQDAYNLFVQTGYKKSINDFKSLLASNPEALQDSYNLFVGQGYGKTIDDYKTLMGVSGGVQPEAEPLKKKEVSDTMVSPSAGTSLASPSPETQAVPQFTGFTPEQTKSLQESATAQTYDGQLVNFPQGQAPQVQRPKLEMKTYDTLSSLGSEESFNESVKEINKKLIDKDEESVVPELNYLFKDYGFNFEQTGAGYDAVKVTAPNGNTKTISIDKFTTAGDIEASNELKTFIESNKPKINPVVNEYQMYDRKIKSQKQVDESMKNLNTDANALNKDFKSIANEEIAIREEMASLDALWNSKGQTQEYTDRYNEVQKRIEDLEAKKTSTELRQRDIKKKEELLSISVGRYNAMRAEQGGWMGGIYNSILEGSSRIAAGLTGAAIDIGTALAPLESQMGTQAYRESFIKNAKDMGLAPENAKVSDYDKIVSSLDEDAKDDIDSKILDEVRKGVKYGEKTGIIEPIRKGLREVAGAETTQQWSDLKKQDFWGGAILGLAESVPAMIGGSGPAGWAQRTAQMYTQVSDQLAQEMQKDPSFKDVSENEKQLLTVPIGIISAVLEEFGFRNAIGSSGLVNNIAAKVFAKSTEKTTAKTFKELVENEVESRIARGLLVFTGAGLAEAETGAAQEIADVKIKDLYNTMKGKKMFRTPDTFGDFVSQVLVAGAQEAVGGFIMGSMNSVATAYNENNFNGITDETIKTFEMYANDDNMKKAFVIDLKNKVNSGKITAEKANQILSDYDNAGGLLNSMPENLNPAQKRKAFGLLLEKSRIDAQKQGKDEALVKKQNERLKEINSELEELSKLSEDAIQEPSTEEGVLRQEGPEVGLPKVGEGDQGQVAAEGTEAVPAQKTEEVTETILSTPQATTVALEALPVEEKTTTTFLQEDGTESPIMGNEKTVADLYHQAIGVAEEERTPSQQSVVDAVEVSLKTQLEEEAQVLKMQEMERQAPSTVVESTQQQVQQQVGKAADVSNDADMQDIQDRVSASETDSKRLNEKNAVIKAAKIAHKTLTSLFPNFKIYLHDNSDSFNSLMDEFKVDNKDTVGNFAVFRNADGKIVGGRIDINLNEANLRTVAHEVTHAVLLKAFGDNPQLFNSFKNRLSVVIKSSDNAALKKFIAGYKNADVRPEEYIAELTSMLANNETKIEPTVMQRILAVINDFIKRISGDKIAQFKNTAELVDFVNTISQKIAAGEEVQVGNAGEYGGVSPVTSRSQVAVKDIDVKDIRTKARPGKRVSKGLSVRTENKVKVVEEAEDLSLDYVKKNAPEVFISNAKIIADYPIVSGVEKFTSIKTVEDAQKVYDVFSRQVADNLKFLVDNFKKELVDISTLWYDGANIIAQRFADKYNVSKEQAAGIIASLSPQKDWYMNVRLAEMVMMAFDMNPVMTKEMVNKQKSVNQEGIKEAKKKLVKAREKYQSNRTKENKEKLDKQRKSYKKKIEDCDKVIVFLEKYIGQDLNSVPPEVKPYYVRLYHELNTTKDYNELRPDGEVLDVARKENGEKAKVAWGSYGEIGKAVSIYLDGSQENITKTLGEMHKIRNFYNNIIDPMSPDKDVTMDTHAVAAALLMALSGNSTQVEQNFGTGTSNSAPLGIKGLYYAFADGYRLAAEEEGLLPRQVQSITWEAIRGVFTKEFKNNTENVSDINKIWSDYESGKKDINETRSEIIKRAGGFKDPTWAREKPTVGARPVQAESRVSVGKESVGRGGRGVGRGTVGGKEGRTITSKSQVSVSEGEGLKFYDKSIAKYFPNKVDKSVNTNDILFNEAEKLDGGIEELKASLPVETLPLDKIIPTQEGYSEERFKNIKGDVKELPLVVKKDGMYYVEDGHHRMIKNIKEGKPIEAKVYDLDAKEVGGEVKEMEKQFVISKSQVDDVAKKINNIDRYINDKYKAYKNRWRKIDYSQVSSIELNNPISADVYVFPNENGFLVELKYNNKPIGSFHSFFDEEDGFMNDIEISPIFQGYGLGKILTILSVDISNDIIGGFSSDSRGLTRQQTNVYNSLSKNKIITSDNKIDIDKGNNEVKLVLEKLPAIQTIASSYIKSKSDGSNPELVKAVEDAIETPKVTNEVKEMEKQFVISKSQVDAYHGSPYDFDKFTTEKIGTGEGAQAFGWGLYFTDLKSIAEGYADKLSKPNFNKFRERLIKDKLQNNVINDILDFSEYYDYDYDKVLSALIKNENTEAIGYLKNNRDLFDVSNKKLYQVTLHQGKTPEQYTWLEWDKQIGDASREKIYKQFQKEKYDKEIIDKSLSETYRLLGIKKEPKLYRPNPISTTGEVFYNELVKYFLNMGIKNPQKEASLFLLKAGIDGVKYPAESVARGATSETARGFNYVVFDENAVTITSKSQKIAPEIKAESVPEVKENIIFTPIGYYEALDKNGYPSIAFTDQETGHTEFETSKKPQISASKNIGGAITGLFSMLRNNNLDKKQKIVIYEISETPSIEIPSDARVADFPFINEVRYDKKVNGKKIKELTLSKEQIDFLNDFYNSFEMDSEEYSDLLKKYNANDLYELENIFKRKISDIGKSEEGKYYRAVITNTYTPQITSKSQQSASEAKRTINKVIKDARAQGFSEEAIRTFLQKKGLTSDEIDLAMGREKGAATRVTINEQTMPGYDRVIGEIEGIVAKSNERGVSEKKTIQNVMDYLMGTKLYENATDVQREQLVRNIKQAFGIRLKSAPSVGRILGTIKDVKNITMTDKELLIKEIKDYARGAKDATVAFMKASAQLSKAIKQMRSEGKITIGQAANILRKFSKVNMFNEESISKFVNYMAKVFKDAEYAEKISNVKRMLPTAKKNVLTKLGISKNLIPDLSKMLSVKPELIPDSVFDTYQELVDMLGKRQQVLSLKDVQQVSEMTNQVLNALNEEYSQADELKDVFNDYENKVLDEDGKVMFAETLAQMVKDNIITNEEAEILKKYKSLVVEKAPKDEMTDEEIAQEKEQLINGVNAVQVDHERLPSRNERELGKSLAKLIRSGVLEKMDNEQLKNLLKVIDNINNGYLPHYAQVLVQRMNSLNNSGVLSNAITLVNELPLTKLYSRFKSLFIRDKNYLDLMIGRSPLYYIDQVFGNFKGKEIFNSLFKQSSQANEMYSSRMNKIQNMLGKALEDVSSSFSNNPNKVRMSSYKMMAYALQLEHDSNPGAKGVYPAADFLKATIKHILAGKSHLGEDDAKMLQEILDNKKFKDSDGNISAEKIYASFNPAEKRALETIKRVNESVEQDAEYTASVIRGNKATMLSNYVHHNVMPDTRPDESISGITSANSMSENLRPSSRGKSLIERTTGLKPLDFNIFTATQRGANYVLMDYYLTEPIRTARMTINETENALLKDKIDELVSGGMTLEEAKQEAKLSQKDQLVLNALNDAYEQVVKNILVNKLSTNSFADEVANFITKQGYRAVLASSLRWTSELSGNLGYVMLTDPKSYIDGWKNYSGVFMSPDAVDVLINLGSMQSERLYSSETLSGRMIDQSIMSQAAGVKGGRANGRIANVMQTVYNNSLKKGQNFVEATADTLITTPDKLMMRPLWFGAFASEFKKMTGQDVDFEKIAANDEEYMKEFKEELDKARDVADDKSVMAGATDNAFMGVLKGTVQPNANNLAKAFNVFNNYMTRFMIYEYTTARTGLYASMGNGTISRKQGVALMAGVTTRMVVYSLLMNVLGTSLVKMATGQDDDDEDEKSFLQKAMQAVASGISGMILGRDFGNATKTLVNYGIEKMNEKYLDFLREGDYDPYKDALQYSAIPKETDGRTPSFADFIINMSGPVAPAAKTGQLIFKKMTEKPKKEEAAIERSEKEWNIRIPLEVAGNAGLVPLYKDIRKAVLANMYKDLKEAEKQTKIKKAEAERDKARLHGFKNKTDLKRYEPELYEQEFGEDSPMYEIEQAERDIEKEKRNLERQMKDEAYGYTPKEKKKSSGFGPSEGFGPSKKKESGFGPKSGFGPQGKESKSKTTSSSSSFTYERGR